MIKLAAALTALCKDHRVMIWTALRTVPIMATEVQPNEKFHYKAEQSDGAAVIIRRVLS